MQREKVRRTSMATRRHENSAKDGARSTRKARQAVADVRMRAMRSMRRQTSEQERRAEQ